MRTSYLFDHPSPCRNCGKAAAKKTETLTRSPDQPYAGNLRVMRERKYRSFGQDVIDMTLWDGETYIQKYGFFCTLDCASDYANRTVRTLEGKAVK